MTKLNFNIKVVVLLFFLFIPILISPFLNYEIFSKNNFIIKNITVEVERPDQINYQNIPKLKEYINYKASTLIKRFGSFIISLKNYVYLFIAPYRFNDSYIWSNDYGFYPIDTVRRFFNDWGDNSVYSKQNRLVLSELKNIEAILKKKNIKLIVIKPPAKIQILPNGIENFFYDLDEITKRKHSYNNEDSFLIDINIIREKYGLKNNEVFSDLGFHWNFYSSCLFTNEFLFKANLNSIDCEDYEYKTAQMTDIDIFMIHPFFDRTNFSKKLKYPKLSKDKIQYLPRIAIIGDSFVDQIIYNILHSTSIENLKKITFFDYFDVQKKINPDGTYDVSDLVLNEKFISEFEKNEFVVMVLSDSNYPRNINSESFYGFYKFLKEHYAF